MNRTSQPAIAVDGPVEVALLDQQSSHLIRRAHQRASSILLSEIEQEQLTPAQGFALVRLFERGKLSQNHLGRLSAMDPATIQGVVRRLGERGLVTRVPDPGDRRRITLSLSPSGLEVARRLLLRVAQADQEFLGPLSLQERQQFLSLLKRLV